MNCPYCLNKEHKVISTKKRAALDEIHRLRECLECHQIFMTKEKIEAKFRYKAGEKRFSFTYRTTELSRIQPT